MHSRREFLQAGAALAVVAGLGSRQACRAAEQDLIVRSADPLNAEPRLNDLVTGEITSVKHFYVRNHGELPKVDAAGYKLKIEGLVEKPLELTLAEIKARFGDWTAEATLTCAGNRRQEMSAIKPVGGVQWDAGAIGNAKWTGPPLMRVLQAAGVKPEAKHVWFEGLDQIKEKDGSTAPFGGSIPIDKAMSRDRTRPNEPGRTILMVSSLLAHSMNDQPLTAEHGFPLRAVVIGYIGARSVKWLSKITVSDRPSPNHYLAEAYKIIQSDDKDEVAKASPIYSFPINAAICSPAAGTQLKAGRVAVSGYALPDGEHPTQIAKVEVSGDGGKNWTKARLLGRSLACCWQQWSAELDLPPGKHELVVRATDSRGNKTPEKAEWNLKGYMYNGWYRVSIEAV
jgi:sulfite oxidase